MIDSSKQKEPGSSRPLGVEEKENGDSKSSQKRDRSSNF